MNAKGLTFGLLITSTLAAEFFSPAHGFGSMFPRDGLAKRQGYYPSTTFCGEGNTCAEACGPTTVECPSEFGLFCYDPTVGDHCCPDLSGNSCNEGYYCTSDGVGTTYCCPEGMDTSECAVAYSLTISLIRETGTVAIPSSEALPTSSLVHISSEALTPITTVAIGTFPTGEISPPPPTIPLSTSNITFTASSPPEFTGGAQRVVAGGMVVVAGAAGLAGYL